MPDGTGTSERANRRAALTRHAAHRFRLYPTPAQEQLLWQHAGARRLAYNHHVGRVKANLEQRAAELEAGVAKAELTPALPWSKVSFINHMNQWKDGRDPTSRENEDGTRGLSWRGQVCADVFECASVDAAAAFKAWKDSRSGARAGKPVGFPDFQSRHRSTPKFRLRSKGAVGATQPIRPVGPHHLRLSKLGEIRVGGSTRRLRRAMEAFRFNPESATVKYERGGWWVSVAGKAAEFHHLRRSTRGRHQVPAGMDRGYKDLAVVADADRSELERERNIRALHQQLDALRRANQRLARTKPDSVGRRKARERLVRIHARIAWIRAHHHHQLTKWATTHLAVLGVEDLNAVGLVQMRNHGKSASDAALGMLGRQIEYKAGWYGLDLVEADRFFPSSKMCSGCGHVKPELALSERVYRCDHDGGCGLELDRDLNAAINLAHYAQRELAKRQAGSQAAGDTTPLPAAA